jgi:signal transduction histidine kinase
VYDDSGDHVGFAKVTHDQTQQREHEQERQRFIDQRTHLLAVTAHELRNPIAVIDGSASALASPTPETMSAAERNTLLSAIGKGVERLRRLAADLSDSARMRGETPPMEVAEVSLAATILSAVARSRAAGTVVHVDAEPPSDAVLLGDAERLAQALDNLIDNAVRHGAPPFGLAGGVDGAVSIKVTDGGPGVPAAFEPHLFEPFAKDGPTGGTGLGLSLVREIARQHGGDALYHPPTDGQPTAFEIRLPSRH